MQLKTANKRLAATKPGMKIERANYGRGDRYTVYSNGCGVGRFYTIAEAFDGAMAGGK